MYRLIQEDYLDSRWKILVCCILLNRTQGCTVRKLLPDLFGEYPGPRAMANANACRLYNMVSHLGFGERRTQALICMSKIYADVSDAGHELFLDVRKLPGCGQYAADCWDLLVLRKKPAHEVTDKELRKYMERENML